MSKNLTLFRMICYILAGILVLFCANLLNFANAKSEYDGGTFEDDPKSYTVRPVVTLSSKIKITGGDGSKNNPYTIA